MVYELIYESTTKNLLTQKFTCFWLLKKEHSFFFILADFHLPSPTFTYLQNRKNEFHLPSENEYKVVRGLISTSL